MQHVYWHKFDIIIEASHDGLSFINPKESITIFSGRKKSDTAIVKNPVEPLVNNIWF